jgi:hypothetical protein
VDAHLKGVPGLGTLTARGLAGGDLEALGGQTDGALDAELLVLGTVDELLAHLLEGLNVARGHCQIVSHDPAKYAIFPVPVAGSFSSYNRPSISRIANIGGLTSDPDLVDLGTIAEVTLLRLVVRHGEVWCCCRY